MQLVVSKRGYLRCLHGSAAEQLLLQVGEITSIRRSSRVDLWDNLTENVKEQLRDHPEANNPLVFWADMSLCGGNVLGPFYYYVDAIEAEIDWLTNNNFSKSG